MIPLEGKAMRMDAHLDTALWLAQGDIRSAPQAAADFERMAANLDIAFLAVFVHPEKRTRHPPAVRRKTGGQREDSRAAGHRV